MQWVVTTGRTVDEARERALDALGIDASDLEIEVLDEPGTSLFGLRRTDARIRARVRPTRPRPKLDRRNRRKGGGGGGGRRRRSKKDQDATQQAEPTSQPAPTPAPAEPATGDAEAPAEAQAPSTPARGRGRRRAETTKTDDRKPRTGTTGDTMSDITLDEQEPSALGFVQGLVDAFGADADVHATSEDDEHLEIAVTGEDLGLLVGPRGATLNAIQELTRTAVAQQHSGRLQGRLRVDVAGYRARRKEALERFAAQQADRVKETGTPVALEPMSPPDRKIVHDAVNEIDGVHTTSEGEDRRRHVVILPD